MKKIFLFLSLASLVLASCEKFKDTRPFGLGNAGSIPVISSSVAAVAPAPADSNATVLSFSWTPTYYATDSNTIKYIVEVDLLGNNFATPATKTIIGTRNTSFTAKDLNAIALGFGLAFNVPKNMEARVVSSYGNNNEQYKSEPITFSYRPYVVPPKVALPTSGRLFLVGSATSGGWNNPVPTPTQEFAKVDATTFVGVFTLNGGAEYLMLPVNGDWGNKYAVANNGIAGLNNGGDFDYNLSQNFPGPTASGTYKIVVNFQTGKFTVTPYNGPTIPANLFMVGSATPGGWNNPVPVPSQQFTRKNSVQYELTIPLNASAEYLFLPVNGDWGNKYAVPANGLTGLSAGGFFGYNLNDNFPGPQEAGTYKISLNFGINSATDANRAYFTAVKQ